MFRSIDLYIIRNACHELFCVFRDFYESGTQDAEVTRSLLSWLTYRKGALLRYACYSNWHRETFSHFTL